jgi:hypothetical protein
MLESRLEESMSRLTEARPVAPGDTIVVEGHHVGEKHRSGEIREVLGVPGHEHYLVRWEDGRETVFYPSSDATIRRAGPPRRRTRTARA